MKRLLLLGTTATLLAITAWAPAAARVVNSLSESWAQQPVQPGQRQQDQGKTQTFSGTITKSGDNFTLTDKERGVNYKLDDPEKAGQFEGKAVKVTGTVDAESQIIHVETIQEAS